MPGADKVSKTIQSVSDIEPNDIFDINASEYFIVTRTYTEDGKLYADGLLRDGILNVGMSEDMTFEAEKLVSKTQSGDYTYRGMFAYQGATEDQPHGITGEPLDMEEILTAEAFEEYQED